MRIVDHSIAITNLLITRTMGTQPLADLYFGLKELSSKGETVDNDALILGKPQRLVRNPADRFQLFRIGDAVSSRNRRAAIYNALRLLKEI